MFENKETNLHGGEGRQRGRALLVGRVAEGRVARGGGATFEVKIEISLRGARSEGASR